MARALAAWSLQQARHCEHRSVPCVAAAAAVGLLLRESGLACVHVIPPDETAGYLQLSAPAGASLGTREGWARLGAKAVCCWAQGLCLPQPSVLLSARILKPGLALQHPGQLSSEEETTVATIDSRKNSLPASLAGLAASGVAQGDQER